MAGPNRVHASNQAIGVVPVLIKANDANDSFTDRSDRHSLGTGQANVVAPSKSSSVGGGLYELRAGSLNQCTRKAIANARFQFSFLHERAWFH